MLNFIGDEVLSCLVLIVIGTLLAIIIKYFVDQAQTTKQLHSEENYQQYKIYNKLVNAEINNQENINNVKPLDQTTIEKQHQQRVSNQNENYIEKEEEIANLEMKHPENQVNKLNSEEVDESLYQLGEQLIFEEFKIETQIEEIPKENVKKFASTYGIFFEEEIDQRVYLNPIMPKQKQIEKTANLLQLLSSPIFGMSKKEQEIQIGQFKNQKQLIQEFACNNKQLALQFQEFIQGCEEITLDQNNYYIAFGYQYFIMLLNIENDEDFFSELGLIQKENLKIFSQKFLVSDEMTNEIQDELVAYLRQLRLEKDKRSCLKKLFNDKQSLFCGVAIIYIRNLAAKILQQEKENYEQYIEEVLFWENECLISNLLNQLFALNLNLMITEFEVNKDSGKLNLTQYGNNQQKQISLFWNEDHFEICYPIAQE